MKNIFKLGGILLFLAFIVNTSYAQKFGYLNSALIVSLMPEMKQAESTLEVTQTQYQKQGKKMVEEFQMSYQDLQKKDQEGSLSPKQMEEATNALREKEAGIQSYEQEMMQKIQGKRAELLKPLLEKVNTAINEVAKENTFQFVFDASPGSGILLYADESQDVTKLVLDKLGIEIPEAPVAPEGDVKNN